MDKKIDVLFCIDCGQDTVHNPDCALCDSKKWNFKNRVLRVIKSTSNLTQARTSQYKA